MLTKEGVKALLKVKEQKLAEPESLIMHTYLDSFGATCIGGQLILNEYGKYGLEEAEQILLGCHKLASSVLGIPFKGDTDEKRVTDSLFHRLDWDQDLVDRWQSSSSSEEKAWIVAEVIDRFIDNYYQKEEANVN